jgi:serine/threonine-protein kinase
VAIAMKQVSQPPQRPSSIEPRVSPALDAVVMRALEKDPARRFQSAEAFIAALDAALANPGAAGEGTAAFAAMPAAVVVDPDEEEERRRRRRLIAILVLAAVLLGALLGLALTRDTTTEVPKVTGNQLNVAISLLEQDGFKVGDVKRVQREAPAGTVFEQDPVASPPGPEAELDCAFITFFCSKPEVSLTVSAGPGRATIPSTAGLERDEALRKLERAGFEGMAIEVNSERVESGLVISSTPSGGTVATRGSTVTLRVSSGPRLSTVPVLVGANRGEAVQRIRGRGLVPQVSEEASAAAEGEVIRQSPSAGSELPRGSSVSIVVSEGEEQATIPNVIGKERREAVELLRAEGLVPSVEEEETEVAAQVGRVTDQFPPPGNEVEPGTEVTIVVGRAAPEAAAPEGE